MHKKIILDISASSVQVVVSQILGVIVFVITSRYLDKQTYGEMNFVLALLAVVTSILTLRLDQIVVRKVAAGEDSANVLTLFGGHVLASGVFFYLLLLAGSWWAPSFFNEHRLLLLLAISQLLTFFSLPYKLIANGKERYGYLATMSLVSNIVRALWLSLIVIFSEVTIRRVLAVFIVSSLAELIFCAYVVYHRMKVSFSIRFRISEYRKLVRESLPQVGAAFLNAGIARVDWILLGLLSTPIVLAEYSFAYKVFELSPVPMLIIAPVLLSRFSRYYRTGEDSVLAARKEELGFLIRIEMIFATLLPLVLMMVWTPVVSTLTAGKYGAVNEGTMLLLSLSIPFQYLINLLWTIQFAQNRLAFILKATTVTGIAVIAGDIILIPMFGAEGAAIAFLISMILQYLFYLRATGVPEVRRSWPALLICCGAAFTSGLAAHHFFQSIILRLSSAIPLYCVMILVTGQFTRSDWRLFKKYAYR